jgi:phosphatidate cytidylyltransferase
MSRRDPYEGDEAAAWGNYAGTEPRWRDDQQGFVEPPPGRSVFGDESPGRGDATSYEDAYSQHSYEDSGYQQQGRQGFTNQGYEGQQHQQHEQGRPHQQPPPQEQHAYDPRGYVDTSYVDGGRGNAGYDESYDDGYDDDVYREPTRGFADPQDAPRRAARGEGRRAARQGQGQGGERDMRMAVMVGVGLAVLALILFYVGPVATMALVVAVLGAASFEYFTATQRAGFDPLMPVGVVATVCAALAAYNYGQSGLLLVVVMSFAVCTIWYLIGAGGERPMANIGATLLGIVWIGVLGSYAGLLLGVGSWGNPHGIAYLLAALLPTVGYDIGALFVGRSAGSRPLSAASPNKTVEGLVGGMVLAVVGGLLLGVFKVDPFDSIAEGLTVGLIAALAAPLGDLSESLIKRDLGIKDMGTLLPGHGGLLDRFDALLFVLPAVFYTLVVTDYFLT